MTAEELLERAGSDDLARLRWHLCRLFRVAPWSKLGRSLGDEECLALAAQLVLDRQGTAAQAGARTPHFDGAASIRREGPGVWPGGPARSRRCPR